MARMRAQDRRRQLLEVAADLFAKHGYRGTTTARLAEAAGITEPILYRHFDNKLDLFVTLIDEVGREVLETWKQALDGVEDPSKRLAILLASNPATHARGKGIYRVIFQAMTEVEADSTVVKPLRKHFGRLHEFITEELEELQALGAVRDDQDPAVLSWLLMNVAIGYGMISPLGIRGQSELFGKGGMQRLLEQLVTV